MNETPKMKFCIYNAIKTPDGTILRCENSSDYLIHEDKISNEVYINEGIGLKIDRSDNVFPFEDLKVMNTDPHEKIRPIKFWASYGKSGKEDKKMMSVDEMEDDHLEAILRTQKGIKGILDHIFMNELIFRKEKLLEEIKELCEKDRHVTSNTKKMKI